jgi:tRNA(Ile2) C34 agmatinyltransferase TiaS
MISDSTTEVVDGKILKEQPNPNYIQALVGYDSMFNKKVKYWQREFISSINYDEQKIDMYAYKPTKRKMSVFVQNL